MPLKYENYYVHKKYTELWVPVTPSQDHYIFDGTTFQREKSCALHPRPTTSQMALHPKSHYIPSTTTSHNATTSHIPLHPTMIPHPMYHFIPQCYYIPCSTSSHIPLHPTMLLHPMYHFIPYVTSSYMPLHPIGHFIP